MINNLAHYAVLSIKDVNSVNNLNIVFHASMINTISTKDLISVNYVVFLSRTVRIVKIRTLALHVLNNFMLIKDFVKLAPLFQGVSLVILQDALNVLKDII